MFKIKLKRIIIIVVLFSLIIPLNITTHTVSSQGTENPLDPSVNMTLRKDTQIAESRYLGLEYPTEVMYAQFQGIITVDFNEATRVIVELSATDTWSTAQVSPTYVLFTKPEEKGFGVTIEVPKNEKYQSQGTVTINGIWSVSPSGLSGSIEPVEGRIIVGQFCNFSISSTDCKPTAKVGSESKFKLNIKNEGNYYDSFQIKIKNMDDLENISMDVGLNPANVEINQGCSESITIYVKPNKDITLLKPEIEIEVISNNGTPKGLKPKTYKFELSIEKEESSFKVSVPLLAIIVGLIIFITLVFILRKMKYF